MNFFEIAKAQLKIDEGVRNKPYRDTTGKLTIGIGRNLDDVGLSEDEINVIFENDIVRAEDIATALVPSFDGLTEDRKAVVVNMAFNLGKEGLSKFRKMLAAIEDDRYDDAAKEMLDSKWAVQVGSRALRLAQKMRTG